MHPDRPPFEAISSGAQQRQPRSAVLAVFAVTASLFLVSSCYVRYEERRETIPFSRFLEAVNEGDLVKTQPVTITATTVSGVIRTDESEQTFVATIPPGYERAVVVDELARQGFEIEAGHY